MNVCVHYVKKFCSIILKITLLYQQWFHDHIQIHHYHPLFLLPHLHLFQLQMIFNWILQYKILLKSFFCFLNLLMLCFPFSFLFFCSLSVVMSYNLFVIIYFLLAKHAFALLSYFFLFLLFCVNMYLFFFEPNVCAHMQKPLLAMFIFFFHFFFFLFSFFF